jgi:peptidoglycan/xylan/chitin deacetylase (PgdA/CDA1 family)
MHIFKIPKLVHGIYNRFIWDIHTKEKILFLSFDDGPNQGTTEFILNQLDIYKAKATFFCVGENVAKYPLLYQKIIDKGHSVGNHTFNHLNNKDTTVNAYIDNVNLCSVYVKSDLFRPPYGRISREQATRVIELGYNVIMYTVLTNDFNPDLDTSYILKRSTGQTSKGSIVVFHDSDKAFANLQKILPAYLEHFSNQGYQFKKINSFI